MGLGLSKAGAAGHRSIQNIPQLLTHIKTGDLLFCSRPGYERSCNASVLMRENREACPWDSVHMLLVRKEGFEDKCFVVSTTPGAQGAENCRKAGGPAAHPLSPDITPGLKAHLLPRGAVFLRHKTSNKSHNSFALF
jgi:hypothetical protein